MGAVSQRLRRAFGLVLAAGLLYAGPVLAQAGPPFVCDGSIYQVQSGQLRTFDPVTSSYQDIGPKNGSYNATGYNTLDNYAYAAQGRNIIRIASDGTIERLYNVGFGSFSGDVDFSNNFWLRRTNSRYAKIDLATGNLVFVDFSGPGGGPADVAYDQFGGQEFLIGFSGGGTMFRYNITTESKENIPLPGLPGGGYGATWTDSNGRLFTFNNNTGLLFEVFDYFTNSPSVQQVATGVPSGNNDGFSCSLAPFPNLPPLARDDDFTTPVNVAIGGNVLNDNGSGVDEDPENRPLTIQTTPVAAPSNGTVVLNSDGTFTYTPDQYFIGTDTFEYRVVDETGLSAVATVTIVVTGDIGFTLTKTQTGGANPVTSAGQDIDYEIELQNTGDIPLTNVVLTDVLPDGSSGSPSGPTEAGNTDGDAQAGRLDVGETWTYTLTYTVDQDDVNGGGPLVNTARATTDQTGPEEDDARTPVTQSPSFSLAKAVNTLVLNAPGLLTYDITVINTGNVDLTNPTLTDVLAQGGTGLTLTSGPSAPSGDTDGDGEIDVGETWVYQATFAATQEEIDRGSTIQNTATFDTAETAAQSANAMTSITQTPNVLVTKSVDISNSDAEELLTYTITVQNLGNVSLTSPAITDQLQQGTTNLTLTSGPSPTNVGNGDGDIDVGETWSYQATYDITLANLDDGSDIVNAVTFTSDQAGGNDSATTTLVQDPALSLVKTLAANEPSTFAAIGDTIDFTYTVENTGNVTLLGPITINDNQIGNGLPCPIGALEPGETGSCDQTWTAGQGDLDAGTVTNVARALSDGEQSNADSVTVTALQTPSLKMTKTLLSAVPPLLANGTVLSYSYLVENDGNVTIDGPFSVSDNLVDSVVPATGVDCSSAPASIAPRNGDPLNAGNSFTCTATYALTQNDVDLGSATNVAAATGDFGGAPVVSPTDFAIFPVLITPALTLEKSVVPANATFAEVGDPLVYSYTVTNNGNAAFTRTVFVEDNRFAAPIVCYDPAVEGGDFEPGDVHTCTGATTTYLVDQDDLDAGEVTNEALASSLFAPTSPNPIPVQSPSDTVTVTGTETPALTVVKSVVAPTPSPVGAGDEIFYEIVAENTGNQTLSNVMLSDPLLGPLACTTPEPVTLLRTETLTCTGSYIVMQSDIDGQDLADDAPQIENTATAVATNPGGDPVSATGEQDHPLEEADPGVTVSKTVFPDPGAGPAFTDVDDVVTFRVVVENSGNTTLTSIDVTDSLAPGAVCTVGPLAPTQSDTTCAFSYTILQADIDRGFVDNTVFASAQPANPGSDPVEDDGDERANGPDAAPELELIKSATLDVGTDGTATVGDLISYAFTVRNLGNVTLSDVFIGDSSVDAGSLTYLPADDGDGDGDIDSLAPNATTTVSATHALTQSDIDAGRFENTATVNGSEPDGSAVSDISDSGNPADGAGDDDPTVTPIPRTPALTLIKTPNPSGNVGDGDRVEYTYTVANTGNVTLSDVTVSDDHTSAAGTVSLTIAGDDLAVDAGANTGDSLDASENGVWDTLAPGDTVTFTSTYLVVQGDVDLGNPLTNEASVSATGPPGTVPPQAQDDASVSVEDARPSLETTKTFVSATGAAEDDVITFLITVRNTGNVSLSSVTLADQPTNLAGDMLSLATGPTLTGGDTSNPGVLDVGETWSYTATLRLTQDDVDAGGISNTVTATGQSPNNGPVSDQSDDGDDSDGNTTNDPLVVEIPADPSLDVIKTITSSTIAVNTPVVFEIAVENTGNVTLSAVDFASDTLLRADGTPLTLTSGPSFVAADEGSGAGTLMVGETATYRATYVLTQPDVDAGGLSNQAVVQAAPPNGPLIQDTSDDDTGGDQTDPTELVIPADPSFEMIKSLAPGGAVSFDAVGDVIDYVFTITNTGNVTLTDAFTINDPLITDTGGVITCAAPPLAPGTMLECSGSYSVDQDDLDAGGVANTATADDGTGPTDPSQVNVPAIQNPALSIVKTADPINPEDFFTGAFVNYTYVVTNSGNTTIEQPITVTDNLIPASAITCPAFPTAGIPPDGTYVCRGLYRVTQNDVRLGSATNVASASDGTTTSPQTSETIPSGATPALTLTKTAEADAVFAQVDDEITYTYRVENTGNAAFAEIIEIVDDKIGTFDCWVPSTSDPDLRVGEVISCEATYSVTQEDLDDGAVTNQATAETIFGGTTPVTSPPDDVTVDADLDPELTVTKSAETLPITGVDQVLTYTIEVENTGNQTITNVVVTDPLLPLLSCSIDELAVGASNNACSGTYTVKQSDIDNGELVNVAKAAGVTPQGGPVEDQGTLELPVPAADPGVALRKTANPSPFGPVGSALTYTFSVENTGNVTLLDAAVSDPLFPDLDCVIDRLPPGRIDETCVVALTVTQSMIDDARLTNTASVNASDPFGTEVEATDQITTAGPARMPALETTKTLSFTGVSVGSVVTFTVRVENTGNVTLTPPLMIDEQTRFDGSESMLDAPLELISGDTDTDNRFDVDETWVFTGRYTLTQEDLDAGGFSNSVTAISNGPSGARAVDTSDDGDDGDGNADDDATEFPIVPGPAINAEKTASLDLPVAAGDSVTFTIVVNNIGTVTLRDVSITDTVTRADFTAATGATSAPVLVSGDANGDARLNVSETWVYELTYTLTQEDIDLGGVMNTATASAVSITDGAPVSDVSDDGDDADGNTKDDPTIVTIPPQPDLSLVKTASTPRVLFPTVYEVIFDIDATNTGNVTQNNISILDDITAFVAPSVLLNEEYPPQVAVSGFSDGAANASYDGVANTETLAAGARLVPGQSGLVQITAVFSTATGNPAGENTAFGNSDELFEPSSASTNVQTNDRDGDGIPDDVESATADRDGDGIPDAEDYDPTGYFYCQENGLILSGGLITVTGNGFTQTGVGTTGPITIVRDGSTGEFQFFVTQAGTYTLIPTYPPDSTPSEDRVPVSAAVDVTTLGANPAVLGGSESGNSGFLHDFSEASNTPSYLVFEVEAGDPMILSNNLAVVGCAVNPDVLATKTADRDTAVFGETINFTLSYRNTVSNDETLTLVDVLPEGLLFTPGSARIDGIVAEPVVTGRRLTWPDVDLAAGQQITLVLSARVISEGFYGALTNEAWAEDAFGNIISNTATATVSIQPEGVFDCADIIGKVFDDKNFNGYQDGPGVEPLIDRDAPLIGKGGKIEPQPPVASPVEEPGLPNVRLATVNGDIITTDEYGRFNVPCAALPGKSGENFTLKLDTRSLPTGYRVTTENPRTIRVTAGKLAKLNFGAAVGRVVDIDLMATAFVGETSEPSAALIAGVDQLVSALADKPSVLRLSYIRQGETAAQARRRLKAVEALVRARWKRVGRYKLNIEQTVKRVQ